MKKALLLSLLMIVATTFTSIDVKAAAFVDELPVPVGFVVESAEASGQIFIASGPPATELSYRIFYSETEEAPEDPTTATEYIFGTLPGDGGGTGPFGFNLIDLEPETEYTVWLYHYDTSTSTFSEPASGSAVAGGQAGVTPPPPTPVGLVVEDNLGGAPLDAGEIFLAIGPNNTGEPTIEYRMFYSPTASAPGNPLDATEYSFGSTDGDGGGVNGFGFVLGGLEQSTDYTFWIYQYDTDSEQFSEGNSSASAVSGGESSGVDEPESPNPLPTFPADEVISLFSAAYDDVPVDTWRTEWSQATYDEVVIDGRTMKRYTNLDFVGIETVANQIDATQMEYFNLDVWTPNMDVFRVKLVDFGPSGEPEGGDTTEHEIVFDNLAQGEWNRLQIPLSDFTGLTNTTNIAQLIFSGTPVGGGTVFVDNIFFSVEGEPTVTPPAMPEGFLVTDMIGENPVGNGEIFVAVGPNQVADNDDLIYRLFYSPTADAPSNPQDANEYEFGNTPGDGAGNDAFGFALSGLEEGTEYTAWLYQYDTENEVFSSPATGSAVSGGDGDDPDPTPGVTIPVTFEEDIDWTEVFTNFDGGVATVIDNPDASGINTSGRVARMVKEEGQPWGGAYFTLSEAVETSEAPINMQVWAPREGTTVLFKLENSENPDEFFEVSQTIPVSGEWTELSFDMSGAPDVNLDRVVLIFDLGTVGDGSADFTWYFDNIEYGEPLSTNEGISDLPSEFTLQQNYPNPFNPTTQIRFELPESAQVRLEVYNLMGQRVATLVNENMSAGTHSATFDGASLASGMYLYRLQAGTTVLTRKMMLVK